MLTTMLVVYTTISGRASRPNVSRTRVTISVIVYRFAFTLNVPCKLICMGPGVGPWMVGLTTGVNPTSNDNSK